MKTISTRIFLMAIFSVIAFAFENPALSIPPTQFGARNSTPSTEALTSSSPAPMQPSSSNTSQTIVKHAEPPKIEGVEWLKVPYDKAENEVLALFQRDLPKIEEITTSTAIYEVKTTGQLPIDHQRNLRTKLERVLLTSKKIKVKQCPACEESRLRKTETGDIRYEEFSSDPSRPTRIASDIGVDQLMYSELNYTNEDLVLRVRLVQPSTSQILWSKEYSTADVVKTRENFDDGGPEELSHRDSLSRVLLGEIAFSTVLSPGIGLFPTVDTGRGSQLTAAPILDVFIGEKYDRGRKFFGFQIGGSFTLSEGADQGSPLPFTIRIGPRFGWVFNPYNVTTARYILAAELGGLLGDGITTGFLGVGPEMKMIHRFSVSAMPIYIVPTTSRSSTTLIQNTDGTFSAKGGAFGGLAFLLRASINW